MYRVVEEAMPGNPAGKGSGKFDGLWRVAVYEKVMGRGNVFMYYAAEDITYEEARDLAERLQRELNGKA
jgi:hypothetical protein